MEIMYLFPERPFRKCWGPIHEIFYLCCIKRVAFQPSDDNFGWKRRKPSSKFGEYRSEQIQDAESCKCSYEIRDFCFERSCIHRWSCVSYREGRHAYAWDQTIFLEGQYPFGKLFCRCRFQLLYMFCSTKFHLFQYLFRDFLAQTPSTCTSLII